MENKRTTEQDVRERVRIRNQERKLLKIKSSPSRPRTPGQGLKELFAHLSKVRPKDPRTPPTITRERQVISMWTIDASEWQDTTDNWQEGVLQAALNYAKMPRMISPFPPSPSPSAATMEPISTKRRRGGRKSAKRYQTSRAHIYYIGQTKHCIC